MHTYQKIFNISEYNCTDEPREFKVPQITPAGCQFIDYVLSQIFADLYYIICTIGIAANLIKAIVTAKAFHEWTTTHLYMFNLSISHILFLLSCLLWGFSLSQQYDWQLGQHTCTCTNFITILGHCGSTLFLCIISIDWIVTIFFPLITIQYKKLVFGVVLSLLAWSISIVQASFGLVYTAYKTNNHNQHFCVIMQVTTLTHPISIRSLILYSSTHVVIPVVFVLPSYAKIVEYVVRQRFQRTRSPTHRERALRSDLAMLTLFLICCFTTSCFLLCGCLLYVTSRDCHDECWWTNVINISLEISKLLNIMNAGLCPFIYFAHSIKSRCTDLSKCRTNEMYLSECNEPTIEEVPTVHLVYMSCEKDDFETGPYFATR